MTWAHVSGPAAVLCLKFVSGQPQLINVDAVEIKGVEVELKWAPTEQWYIQGSVGTADSEVVDIASIPAGSAITLGDEVTNTPDINSNLTVAYTIPIGNGDLTLALNYRYVSSMYYSFLQEASRPRDESSNYSYLNANGTYTFGANQQYSFSLWGNNLTEEFSCSAMIDGPGPGRNNFSCEVNAMGEPMYGLSFEAKFGGS